jgi:hypothetical protein
MSINAIYVYTSTAFVVDRACTIEQLVKQPASGNSPPGYVVVQRALVAKQVFTLDPGAYRLSADVSIQPAPTGGHGAPSLAGTAPSLGFEINQRGGTKSRWPDPPAMKASSALGIPLDQLKPFLMDAGEESELPPASSAGKRANG